MKTFIVGALLLLSCTASAQDSFTAFESRQSMSNPTILVADETTYRAFKKNLRVVSANSEIIIGLMSRVEPGIQKYVVETKKATYGTYLQYTLWIDKKYCSEVVKYFNWLNRPSVTSSR